MMNSFSKKQNLWKLYEAEVPHRRFRDEACGVAPAERLSLEHLELLREAFTEDIPGSEKHDSKQSHGGGEERGMRFEEFHRALKSILGSNVEDPWVEMFFNEVDISCRGEVSWKQLCNYLLEEYRESQRAAVPAAALLNSEPRYRHCSSNKREPTVRLLSLAHPPPLRYISVSKGGELIVWNSHLHILTTFGLAGEPTAGGETTRHFRGWTTDAVYMSNIQRVAVATDCRDLRFVNVSANTVEEDVHIFGFKSVLTALCYSHDEQGSELLLLGDSKGGVHLLKFPNSLNGLFNSKDDKRKGPLRIFFPDLSGHSKKVSHHQIPSIHQEPITRIMFEPGANLIMTSSESDATSVVLMSMSLRPSPYVWKGTKCFDYCAPLQLLVTGGCDRTVRLWNRYVTSCPVTALQGHHTSVLDVVIYEPHRQIFSYSRDAELRVWDILTHQCLKAVRLQFPCIQSGRIPEHGPYPFLLLGPPLPDGVHAHLLVGCKDYLVILKLSDRRGGGGGGHWLKDAGKDFEPESASSLTCAAYSQILKQVITGHADSSVCVWDIETGRRGLRILNAHGEDALTGMTLHSSDKQLFTGACSGTIKVWNLLNGLNLHKLEPISNSKVAGLTCLHGNQLLAVGCSQSIAQYNIAAAKDLTVKAELSWQHGGVHKSYITAVCQCCALGVVATASADGDVVIWNIKTQKPALHLHRETRAQGSHPVDGLLFLQHRAGNKMLRNSSVLISSQGGWLSFWGITAEKHDFGQFYAAGHPGERVFTLSSDQSQNTILVSGNSTGWLHIWDISSRALDNPSESVWDRPALLQRWRVHHHALKCADVLKVDNTLLILTASGQGSAGLWTITGDNIGLIGQEAEWSISNPATYRSNLSHRPKEE